MNKRMVAVVFAIGLAAIGWVGWGFVASSWMALAMTGVIAGVYLLGAHELRQFRLATASLATALAEMPQPMSQLRDLTAWLARLHPSLQNPVRQRIEGERAAFPGPALTPYLVGLLVMLGMLGTFLGMVVTFKGAVFALEGSADLAAIRAALAAPIKGLGMSFGTSVAGVAASAMLGLMSTLSRRERMEVLRQLDACTATVLRPFSSVHQRHETFQALQVQAQAMPLIVDRLQALMDGLERRSEHLGQQLLGQQQQFHRDVSVAYTDLAHAVGTSLQDSLSASARVASQTLQPVIEQAMADIALESQRSHQRLVDATQAQLSGQASRWEDTARGVADTWATALQAHTRHSEALVGGLDRALSAFTQAFDERALALQASLHGTVSAAQSAQAEADQQRLAGWHQAMATLADSLASEWQRVGAQTAAQQQAVCQALESAAGQVTERASQHVSEALGGVARLLDQSEALVRSRMDSESQWLQAQGQRMDQLASLWRTELTALREQEAVRGQAAVDRLDTLQAAVAQHLATLGSALEAPMTRLMQTASDVPQAAAEVIAQLRQEMTRLSERDNLALSERTAMMAQLDTLLRAINEAAVQQRAAIESLVGSATGVLTQAGSRFAEALGAQAGQVDEVAAHVAASAVELASLGESFGHGVTLFTATNEKLIDSLQRIEGAIGQSMARSDEQLAYYVAQAREVIDLSISSQQGIVEDLRRLHGAAAPAHGVAG